MTTEYEAKLEGDCVNRAHIRGWRTAKLDKLKRSDPDQLFYRPNHYFLVEFKREGCAPRPQQRDRIKDLRKGGHPVYLVDSRVQFLEILDKHEAIAKAGCSKS